MPTAAELQEDMLNQKVDYDRILRKYRSDGVAEIASENPNVASYCREWEERAETAEARLAARDRELASVLQDLHTAQGELAAVRERYDRLAEWGNLVVELARGDGDTPIGTLDEIRAMKSELARQAAGTEGESSA